MAPTRGGGVSASYRMTGLLSRSLNMTGILTKTKAGKMVMLERPLKFPWAHFQKQPNPIVGAWTQEQVDKLLSHSYPLPSSSPPPSGKHHNQQQQQSQPKTLQTVEKFDVCIIRVMHGWMRFEAITHERILEAIELSHKLLGAKTIVIMTVPITNNVKNNDHVNKMNQINNDIRQIARDWDASASGVQHVLVLEYGIYYNHIIWSSGLHLKYQGLTHPLKATQDTFTSEASFVQDRLKQRFMAPSIAMVCSDMKSLSKRNRTNCNRNYLFIDGQHICPETLASRYAAGVACLLGCVYNGRTIGEEHNDDGTNRGYYRERAIDRKIRACERECNDQFLSVVPIDESWIDTNTTLSSFAQGSSFSW